MLLHTVTVKVDEELKRKMNTIKINWSHYVRAAIQHRIAMEERRNAAERLLENLKARKPVPRTPKGFINKTIRETREAR